MKGISPTKVLNPGSKISLLPDITTFCDIDYLILQIPDQE